MIVIMTFYITKTLISIHSYWY